MHFTSAHMQFPVFLLNRNKPVKQILKIPGCNLELFFMHEICTSGGELCEVCVCTSCWTVCVGTGVVTSVPSDSPDDYAALRDLKNKKVVASLTMLSVAE